MRVSQHPMKINTIDSNDNVLLGCLAVLMCCHVHIGCNDQLNIPPVGFMEDSSGQQVGPGDAKEVPRHPAGRQACEGVAGAATASGGVRPAAAGELGSRVMMENLMTRARTGLSPGGPEAALAVHAPLPGVHFGPTCWSSHSSSQPLLRLPSGN